MKLSHIGLLAATVASAFAESVAKAYNLKLYVEYFDKDGYVPVNGKFLQAVKVDSDTYLFVLADADEATTIQYDYYENLAYIKDDQGTYFVSINDTALVASADFNKLHDFYVQTSNYEHSILDYVIVDLYHQFIPKKDVGDPIDYSKDHYALSFDPDYENQKGAILHYEFVGTAEKGAGIINPSSITDAVKASPASVTLATEFYTGVSTTNPPTGSPTGTETADLLDGNQLGFPDESEYDAGFPTADNTDDDGSNSPTGDASDDNGSNSATETGSKGSASATGSETSSPKSETAKSASDSGSSEAKPSSSDSSKPSSSASSSTNNGNGKLVAGGVGFLALFAAVL